MIKPFYMLSGFPKVIKKIIVGDNYTEKWYEDPNGDRAVIISFKKQDKKRKEIKE